MKIDYLSSNKETVYDLKEKLSKVLNIDAKKFYVAFMSFQL
jgi:hypothetical protein